MKTLHKTAVAASLFLGLGSISPAPTSSAIDVALLASSAPRALLPSGLTVYHAEARQDPNSPQHEAVLLVCDALKRGLPKNPSDSIEINRTRAELAKAFPRSHVEGPALVGYIWRWIDGDWVKICVSNKSFRVFCQDAWVSIDIQTEVIL